MLFTEPLFFVFFALVFAAYWALRGNAARKNLLLAASYLFYGSWDWRFLGLIGICTLAAYLGGRGAASAARKFWLVFGVGVNLGVLFFFKYFNFFADSLAALLGREPSWTTLHVILPAGISFYVFQAISYVVDCYRGLSSAQTPRRLTPHERRAGSRQPVRSEKKNSEYGLRDVALYIAFFPQLVAGPIVRATDFLPQLAQSRYWEHVPVRACLLLFLVGFFKKACLADNMAPYIELVFADPQAFSRAALWGASLLFAVQIYCDFSGYSDMAIAVAGLLGYQLPLNFHFPYFSPNIREFWRHWHITLSTWLRDYLYIPLGGSRGGTLLTMRNLMLTMLLGGLWHGAAWHFVWWGALHGLALALCYFWHTRSLPAWPRMAGRGVTFLWVLLAWVWFRAETAAEALRMNAAMLGLGEAGQGNIPFGWGAFMLACVALHLLARRFPPQWRLKRL